MSGGVQTTLFSVTADDNPAHLRSIDANAWPGVASVPRVRAAALRERRAEANFARALSRAGVRFEGDDPALVVNHAVMFTRVAAGGWIGLAEAYLAGEWETADSDALVDVLEGLISVGYRPKTPRISAVGEVAELPVDLVAHFSGDGTSPFQGHFATGVPTTQRQLVKSYVRGAGRQHTPAKHFVSVTEFAAPLETGRDDLSDAQARSVAMLLDAAGVGPGTHVQIRPAAGAALAVACSERGATVDCAAGTEEARAQLHEQLVFAGAAESVRVASPRETAGSGAYDAIISVEHLETLAHRAQGKFLRSMDASLAPGGKVCVQTVVRSESFPPAAHQALQSLRAYIWPSLSFVTPNALAKLTDQHTDLRIESETRAPDHLAASLRLQRRTFESHARDAAADGFDAVYRRLWIWQLALREALARQGLLGLTQVTLVRRRRRGR